MTNDLLDTEVTAAPNRNRVEGRASVRIGDRLVGTGASCYVVAEIGINHNGDLDVAKRLTEVAAESGCDAVKLQKRALHLVYTPEDLAARRLSPFGETNGDLKRGLELDSAAYEAVFELANGLGLDCFASAWDVESVGFLEQYDPPCHKIPSALLTDDELIDACRATGRPLIVSTGMSTHREVEQAVLRAGEADLIILACTSVYPCPPADVNLARIGKLRDLFGCPVGYSGHELEIWPSIGAVALGADVVERHITLSRELWGSDQHASLEPLELRHLVEGVRVVEQAIGTGELRVLDGERVALEKLRRS